MTGEEFAEALKEKKGGPVQVQKQKSCHCGFSKCTPAVSGAINMLKMRAIRDVISGTGDRAEKAVKC